MPSFRPAPIATLVTVVLVTFRAAGPVAAQAPAGRTPDPETVLVPDHAPEAVQKLWQEMSRWVESRGVQPAIDITEVRLVRPE